MPTASEEWAVRFERVSKRFRRQEGRTLKEFVPALLRGQAWSPAFYALRDVSFSIRRGETVGILGRNGSGKTTILRLIAGVMAPAGGRVWVRGRVSPLLELGAGFHPDLTGGENVFLNASILGMTNQQARARFEEIIDFAELWDFVDMPVKRYSSGMYLRLGFAIAVHSDPDIILIDDALAVGDAPFQDKCFERLVAFQRRGVTIVLVSHVPELLRHFCDVVLLLDAGRLVAEGRADAVLEEYRIITARPAGAPNADPRRSPGSIEALAGVLPGVKRSHCENAREVPMTMRHVIAVLTSVVCGLGVVHAESVSPPTGTTAEKAMQQVAESWMAPWDAGKHEEAYAGLAEQTKKNVAKGQWKEYWMTVRKPLGKLKSRRLIQAKSVKALPDAPGHEGAMLQYESSFEGKALVVETLGLIGEKDGTWRVANYLITIR